MLQKQSKRPRKITEYGYQLIEKQKAKNTYGLREKQFRNYFTLATKDKEQTGNTLLQILESRIDNVIFRAGLAKTRSQARQLVSHRHFKLNGRRVSIASIQVSVNDVLEPHNTKTITQTKELPVPAWLKVDDKTLKVTVVRQPKEDELPIEFDTQKIVQFYSR